MIITAIRLWTKPQKMNEKISQEGQIKQELIMDFTEIPFLVLSAEIKYR